MRILHIAPVFFIMVLSACATGNVKTIGGDRDEHGCIGPAGYSWCEERQKCIRVWEEPCTSAKVISAVYACDGGVGDIKVDYYGQEYAAVETAAGKYKLDRAISRSGARYTGNNIVLWDKAGNAVLELDGKSSKCVVK